MPTSHVPPRARGLKFELKIEARAVGARDSRIDCDKARRGNGESGTLGAGWLAMTFKPAPRPQASGGAATAACLVCPASWEQ